MLSELWQADQSSGESSKTFSSSRFSIFKKKKSLLGITGTVCSSVTLAFSLSFTLQEQYEFCYKVVQEYIDAFSDYANFK